MDSDPYSKLRSFFESGRRLRFKKREMILRAGDIPSGIFYIKNGFVRQYIISKDGQELTTVIYKPDDLFPLMWGLNEQISNRYFEAMTSAELYRVSKEKFIEFIKKEPEILYKLTSRILNRLNAVSERLEYLAFGSAYAKVASILLIIAQRLGEEKEGGVVIPFSLTHKDIAALTGITRETSSIEIKKLERAKIINWHNRTIINIKKLKEESLLV